MNLRAITTIYRVTLHVTSQCPETEKDSVLKRREEGNDWQFPTPSRPLNALLSGSRDSGTVLRPASCSASDKFIHYDKNDCNTSTSLVPICPDNWLVFKPLEATNLTPVRVRPVKMYPLLTLWMNTKELAFTENCAIVNLVISWWLVNLFLKTRHSWSNFTVAGGHRFGLYVYFSLSSFRPILFSNFSFRFFG